MPFFRVVFILAYKIWVGLKKFWSISRWFFFVLRQTPGIWSISKWTWPPPLCAPKFCYILRKNQLFSTSRSRIHKRQKTQTSGNFLDVVKKNNSMCTHQAHDEKFDFGLEWKKSDADFGGVSSIFLNKVSDSYFFLNFLFENKCFEQKT